MLPIVDKPLIQYSVEEAVASGIESILIITGRDKSAIENHFDISFELEKLLLARSYFHSAQLVKAEATARLLVEADPTDAYALVLLGRSLQRQSKREEADKFLRQAQIWGTDGIPELTPTEDETDNDSSTDTDTSKEKS